MITLDPFLKNCYLLGYHHLAFVTLIISAQVHYFTYIPVEYHPVPLDNFLYLPR